MGKGNESSKPIAMSQNIHAQNNLLAMSPNISRKKEAKRSFEYLVNVLIDFTQFTCGGLPVFSFYN